MVAHKGKKKISADILRMFPRCKKFSVDTKTKVNSFQLRRGHYLFCFVFWFETRAFYFSGPSRPKDGRRASIHYNDLKPAKDFDSELLQLMVREANDRYLLKDMPYARKIFKQIAVAGAHVKTVEACK